MRKLILALMILAMTIGVFAIPTPKLISPVDTFYWILGGSVMGNLTFIANATPIGYGNITNVTIYTNVSGTWKSNYTNTSTGTVGAEVNRIFPRANTNINTNELSNGLAFVWNTYSCDNISVVYKEPVALSGGVGNLANIPIASVEDIMNDTSVSVGLGACNVTLSTGILKCNQTSINASGHADQILTPTI